MAKVLTAGIVDKVPIAKQKISELLVRSMLGPTFDKVSPIRSSKLRLLLQRLLKTDLTKIFDLRFLSLVCLHDYEDVVNTNC